ncbi:MAG: helix-turn-helix domain-containing protein, partial [Oscillospiraceae bacterium]|nr:helix-turn-helix domain-containing protein [Oscillospiraceae bacterium]
MINPLNRTGHNIKKLRNSYGETQQELGDVIGVSASAIANYEKGTREVDLQKLQAIAAHYGCSVEKIVNNNIVFHNLQNITFGWHTVTDLIPIVFPIFCSEKA